MDYIHWNNIVADYLFSPARRGQEVFLYLTEDDLLQSVRAAAEKPNATESTKLLAGQNVTAVLIDFWSALRRGPAFWQEIGPGKQFSIVGKDFTDWVNRNAPNNPAEMAKYAWEDWNRSAYAQGKPGTRVITSQDGRKLWLKAPLHLLYLACFTMPFSMTNADVVGNGYYEYWNRFFGPPTRKLLVNGAPMPGNALAQLGPGKWEAMWQEMARWSQQDLGNERGIMIARQLGSHVHVGWPRAQCLLPPAVLSRLPGFFGRHALMPDSNVASEKMRGLLLSDNVIDLPAATHQELKTNSSLGVAVVDMVLNVFSRWTGSTNRRERVTRGGRNQTQEYRGNTYASLLPFLPLHINETEALTWHFRLRIKEALPEDLILTGPGVFQVAVQPETNEWSQEVPGVLATGDAQVYEDLANEWQAMAKLADIQVFVPGGRYSLYQQWAPVKALEHGTQLLLLCRQNQVPAIEALGHKAGNANFEDWSHFANLPTGYRLYWMASLPANAGLPGVEASSEATIVAECGLNFGNRTYLDELPPSFRIINGQVGWYLGMVYLSSGGLLPLVPDNNDIGLWHLPEEVAIGEKFRVVVAGQPDVHTLPYSLQGSALPDTYSAPIRGAFGQETNPLETEIYYDGNGLKGNTVLLQQLRLRQTQYVFHFTPSF